MPETIISLSVTQLVSIGIAGVCLIPGIILGILRWSILRNINQLDGNINQLDGKISRMDDKVQDIAKAQQEAMPKNECALCRGDCQSRLILHQRENLEWMRRQEDKMDAILINTARMTIS